MGFLTGYSEPLIVKYRQKEKEQKFFVGEFVKTISFAIRENTKIRENLKISSWSREYIRGYVIREWTKIALIKSWNLPFYRRFWIRESQKFGLFSNLAVCCIQLWTMAAKSLVHRHPWGFTKTNLCKVDFLYWEQFCGS